MYGKSGKYMLDIEKIGSDYELLMEIQRVVNSNNPDEIIRIEELLDLYKFSYFENVSSEWIINKREHLERIYINNCKSVAKMLLDAGKYQDCIAVLDKVIRLDAYSEELRIMFMKSCSGTGDIKSVISCYEGYVKLLKEELDCSVSPELQNIYDEIMKKHYEVNAD